MLAAKVDSPDAGSPLLVEHRPQGILVLTLNRPDKRNALDFELLSALARAVRVEGAQASTVILRGTKVFSAGFDLNELSGSERDLEADAAIGRAVEALSECPVPVIAQMEGHCHGAAVELALNCDLRIASAGLKLSLQAVSLGVVYRPQLMARMIATVGLGRTQRLLLGTPILDADEALAWGLLSEVVPGRELQPRVEDIASTLAAAPASAVRGTKAALNLIVNHAAARDVLVKIEAMRRVASGSSERKRALSAAKTNLRKPPRR
jgi:enoyl-CoA hydratase/carnithine racemase